MRRQQSFSPVMSAGGNISATTSTPGTNWTAFDDHVCSQLTIINDTGAAIEWRQDGQGVSLPIADGSSFTVFGIDNTNRIGVKRVDSSNTPVTVKARFEV